MCEFILTRGPRKGEKCDKNIKNYNLCKAHQPKDDREGLDSFLDEKQEIVPIENKIRKSVFAFTFNSNKEVQNMSDETKNNIKKMFRYLFDEGNIIHFIVPREGHPCFREMSELLVEKSWDYRFETGNKLNRLHVHAFAEFDHRTCLQVDLSRLKQLFRDFFGENWYINVRAKRTQSSDAYLHYMNKDIE